MMRLGGLEDKANAVTGDAAWAVTRDLKKKRVKAFLSKKEQLNQKTKCFGWFFCSQAGSRLMTSSPQMLTHQTW